MYNSNTQTVRFVGTFVFVMGLILLLITGFAVLLLLLATTMSNANVFIHSALSVALAVLMAISLIGCGGQMQRLNSSSGAELENLRLVWTALVLIMVICGLASFWLVPPLAALAILVLAALFGIRRTVIELTSHR